MKRVLRKIISIVKRDDYEGENSSQISSGEELSFKNTEQLKKIEREAKGYREKVVQSGDFRVGTKRDWLITAVVVFSLMLAGRIIFGQSFIGYTSSVIAAFLIGGGLVGWGVLEVREIIICFIPKMGEEFFDEENDLKLIQKRFLIVLMAGVIMLLSILLLNIF